MLRVLKGIDATAGNEGAAEDVAAAQPAVELAPAALAAIRAHARRAYPRECCGVVYAATGSALADRVREAQNLQDQLHAEDPRRYPRDARTAYHLDLASLLAMSKSLHEPGAREIARLVYHSHCDAGAYFSASDHAAAVLDGQPAFPVDHLVVAVSAAGAGEAAQFSWDARAARYVEVRRLRWASI